MLADLKLLHTGKSLKRRRSMQRGWTWAWKIAAAVALVGLAALLVRNERDRRAAVAQLNASPFEKSGTTNYAAWKALERGGMMGSTFAAAGFSNAIQEYERAIALDPNYAAAWSSLSGSLFLSVDKGLIPGIEALHAPAPPPSKQLSWTRQTAGPFFGWRGAVSRSITILSMPNRSCERQFDWPLDAPVLRHNLACMLWFYGRFDEAESLEVQVIPRAPSLGGSDAQMGLIHASRGRFADALTSLGECIMLKPNWPMARARRAEILWLWIVGQKPPVTGCGSSNWRVSPASRHRTPNGWTPP